MIRINIDNHQDLASAFRVFSIPCVVLLKDGKAVEYLRKTDNLKQEFEDMVYKAESIGFA